MKILAIDSSGMTASVAVADGQKILAEFTTNDKKTHSQTLLPMLDDLVRMTGLDLADIDAIAVAAGPGSFTGLRIGSATAKGLGLALDRPLIAVPTVEALAANLYDVPGLIVPMMDARRSQVYTGIFRFTDHALVTVREQWPCDAAELCSILDSYGEPVTVLGDGVPVCREILKECLHVSWSEAPAHLNRQRAAAVAITAARYYEEGRTVSAEAHVPEYLRLSQAERERAERQKMDAAKKEEQA